MTQSNNTKLHTLGHNLSDQHILVVTESTETHKLVKKACERIDDQRLGCLQTASMEDVWPLLEAQHNIVLILLSSTLHEEKISRGVIKQIRGAVQHQDLQIIVLIEQMDAASVEEIIQEVEIESVWWASDLTVERLSLDFMLTLHNREYQMALTAENEKLHKQHGIQKHQIDVLQQNVRKNTQFKATLEATSDFVGVADPMGRVFYVNAVGRKISGIGPDDDISNRVIADYHPEEANRLLEEEAFPTILKEGYWKGEVDILTPNGNSIVTSQVIIVQRREDGEVEFFATIARDISSYKRLQASLEEQERFLQLVIDNIPQYIFWKDREFNYLGCNQNFARAAGLDLPEKIIDKTDYDFSWDKSKAELYRMQDDEVMNNDCPQYHVIDSQLHRNGTLVWLDMNRIPLHDDKGRVKGLLITYSDITERVEANEALKEYSEHLETMVEESTRDLTQALEDLKVAQHQLVEVEKMAALGNLVAGVAHEINTPFGVGVTAASTLYDETKMFLEVFHDGKLRRSMLDTYIGTAQESSQLILRNLSRAAELVQSFKQMAVDQTSLEQRTFAIKPYTEEVLRSLMPKVKQAGHHIEIIGDDNLELNSFPGAYSQLINHLVSNSLMHAYSQGETGCLQLLIVQTDNKVVLEYCDDGCGIPAENVSKIFEPFFSTARDRGGTGLGLPVVYNLINKKLGGTIRCESEVKKYTKFTIQLPLHR